MATDLQLRAASAGNLDEAENGSSVQTENIPNPLVIRALVPSVSGTGTPTLSLHIEESNDDSTWNDLGVFPDITAAGEYFLRIANRKKYIRHVAAVSGTTPNFGAVVIDASLTGRYTK